MNTELSNTKTTQIIPETSIHVDTERSTATATKSIPDTTTTETEGPVQEKTQSLNETMTYTTRLPISTKRSRTEWPNINTSLPCSNPNRFQCANKLYGCIPVSWKCDGINDCGDNSDEADCDCDHVTEFNCRTTPPVCVNRTKLCDGIYDCPFDLKLGEFGDSFDEYLCPARKGVCSAVSCDGMCLLKCSGRTYCSEHQDLINCSCTSMQTRCKDGMGCIEARKWCDGYRDCRDGSDEEVGCQTAPCPNRGRRCAADNSCINPSMVCDRTNDCPDGSDEKNCIIGCRSTEFKCNDGRCIDLDWKCDGKKDCASGEDEALASCNTCTGSQFQCLAVFGWKSCFNSTSRCDGISHCNDGSDEAQCVNIGADGPSNPGDSNKPVQMTYKGEQGFSLCADNWNKTWSDLLCKQLGYKESQETNLRLEVQTSDKLLRINPFTPSYSRNRNFITSLSQTGSCSSDRLVGVSCKLLECGIRKVSNVSIGPYIINGQEALKGAWPWQVYLEIRTSESKYSCGGSLINDRWILTAAHCLEGVRSPSNVTVHAGSTVTYGTDPRTRILKVDRVVPHPRYEDLLQIRNVLINDVGLLRLSSPVIFTETIAPVCLAPTNVNLNEFKVCVATGWGKTRSEYVGYPTKLQQGKMKPRTMYECYRAFRLLYNGDNWKATRTDFDYFFCAGNIPPTGGVDTCYGDSGGPLVCQDNNDVWSVVGVTSFGFSCTLTVLTKVSYYNSWITNQMLF